MSTTTDHLQTAIRFAQALDESDDGTIIADMLSVDCVYTVRDKIHLGPDAIIATYVENDKNAQSKFDRVEYQSDVEPLSDTRFAINYLDRLTHSGQTHDHRCQQILSFNKAGLICQIKHVDLPSETESLKSFLDSVGVNLNED